MDQDVESRDACAYCGGYAGGACGEDDHWPVPRTVGGRTTIRACVSCHRMVDVIPVEDWPVDFAVRAFQNAGREGRLLISKAMKILAWGQLHLISGISGSGAELLDLPEANSLYLRHDGK